MSGDNMDKDAKQDFFDKPENIQKMLKVFYALCALLVIVDFVVYRKVYHSWENIPAFYAIYGFIGCVVLVIIAKWMRTFLMREEDYYDK